MFGGTVRGKLTTLRLPMDADLDLHKRWAADMRVRRAGPIGRWHEPASTATWKDRWTEEAKDKSSVLWSIAAGDATIGYVRVRFEGGPRSSEIVGIDQFVIDPEQQRKGFGFDAALALHRWIFDYANVRMAATDRIAADDIGRQRILEKLGHVRFGHGHDVYYRDGTYVDQFLYQLERDVWLERFPTEREYAPLSPETER